MAPARQRALAIGRQAFGPDWMPGRLASAPGRLELLGNHVDYNGGPVLAAAIDRSVIVLTGATSPHSRSIEAVFADADDSTLVSFDPEATTDWRNASPPPEPADYLRGAVAALQCRPQIGLSSGLRLAVAGDVPIGLGLSSSAALCVALTLALSREPATPTDLVLAAQDAEHRAGTPCGTMDQSASVAGGVILFDGATLDITRLNPDLGDYTFAIADSGVERSLGASSYPIRVRESREVLNFARQHIRAELDYLADLRPHEMDALEGRFSSDIQESLLRRARHVVSETRRVHEGLDAMNEGDWPRFGRLMSESGHSSAVDYEISHPRVEELVAEARSVPGVLGARMMGGGEGGTALMLLARDAVPSLERSLSSGYFRRHAMGDPSHRVHIFGFASGAAAGPWPDNAVRNHGSITR
ncbi:MAG: galactokinase [Thermomicrobiales bacterium]